MKTVLLFGAGKSATVLIEYLLQEANLYDWHLTVVDEDRSLALSKLGDSSRGEALSFNVQDPEARAKVIRQADLVISLLPPHLHIEVALDCLDLGKHLLTASYLTEEIKKYADQIEAKGVLFLYEMGLDPGIDHISAMSLIDSIREKGGEITSFISHCGGLVAPESDNNPWNYKISWNPRNVVTAGRDGARFKQKGQILELSQREIFSALRMVNINGAGDYAWYPNRDSLSYTTLYGLEQTSNFIRTTLRHPAYLSGWKNLLELELTNDEPLYHLFHPTLKEAYQYHFERSDKSSLLQQLLSEDKVFAGQINYLGYQDEITVLPYESFSPALLLQFSLEKKLALSSEDKDMIVMLHEISYLQQGKRYETKSSLVVKGNDALHTAMAKTVGLPLGIMASLLLREKIKLTGLKVPIEKEIYQPVLAELEKEGIRFHEQLIPLA